MANAVVSFKSTGQRELVAKLRSMDRKMRRSISGKAVRAGAKVTVKALRSAAPKDSGKGAKALGTKVKTYRGSMVTVAITGERTVTARRGKEPKNKAKYGGPHFHLIEYGTGERFWTGEKKAREFAAVVTARKKMGKDTSAAYVQANLANSGSFGRNAKFYLKQSQSGNWRGLFTRDIRAAQGAKGVRLLLGSRKIKRILADIRTGKRTGRVSAKPFFQKAWRGSIAAVQAAQVAVLRREIEAAARGAA